jgi:hypothetical protein
MPYITRGLSLSLSILTTGVSCFDLTKRLMRMAIEKHRWRIYEEGESFIRGGPNGSFRRFCQTMMWMNPGGIRISFEPQDSTTVVSTVYLERPRQGLTMGKLRRDAFGRMDSFWDSVSGYCGTYELGAVRLDPYIRKKDFVHEAQRLFMAQLERSLMGGTSARCPCCNSK